MSLTTSAPHLPGWEVPVQSVLDFRERVDELEAAFEDSGDRGADDDGFDDWAELDEEGPGIPGQ